MPKPYKEVNHREIPEEKKRGFLFYVNLPLKMLFNILTYPIAALPILLPVLAAVFVYLVTVNWLFINNLIEQLYLIIANNFILQIIIIILIIMSTCILIFFMFWRKKKDAKIKRNLIADTY